MDVPNAMVAVFIAQHGFEPGAYLDAWTDPSPCFALPLFLFLRERKQEPRIAGLLFADS